jgi:hypothetical protein
LPCLVLVLVTAAGCGELGDGGGTKGPRTIGRAQVEAHPAGSPERAFIEWWRDVLAADAVAAAARYDPALRITPGDVRRQRFTAAGWFSQMGPPRIVEVLREGDEATIHVLLQRESFAPNGRRDVGVAPRAVHLRRIDGEWKLSDNMVLRLAEDEAIRQTKALERAG